MGSIPVGVTNDTSVRTFLEQIKYENQSDYKNLVDFLLSNKQQKKSSDGKDWLKMKIIKEDKKKF